MSETYDDLRDTVATHGDEIDAIKREMEQISSQQVGMQHKMDGIQTQLTVMQTESKVRDETRSAEAKDIRDGLSALTQQMAEHTGVQKRNNELAEESLRRAKLSLTRWQKVGIAAGIVAAVAGAALSSQTIDTALTGHIHFLNSAQGAAQQ